MEGLNVANGPFNISNVVVVVVFELFSSISICRVSKSSNMATKDN